MERKACPVLSADSGMRFPLGWPSGNRIPVSEQIPGRSFRFANPHRLRPAAGVLARSLQTLRVCLTLAPCTEFDSPRYGASVDGLESGADTGSTSHLFWAVALRGESARSLREPAPASAGCRRPRPRAKNARVLHRVRFSAVRTRNKKAGRYEYLPAYYFWWRRGESNSGPRKPPDWHLQAQSLV